MSVLLFYKCFFSVERGHIIRFFEIVNSKNRKNKKKKKEREKEKRCKYNSINFIDTITKERIDIFVRESVPGSLMLQKEEGRGS